MVGLAPISVCGQMSGPVRYNVLIIFELTRRQTYFLFLLLSLDSPNLTNK